MTTTTEQNADGTTRADASTPSQNKRHLGLAAVAAVAVAGLAAGLVALIIGVTGDADSETPSPRVPASVDVPFDPSDPAEMQGIDNRLYELADRFRKDNH